MSDLEDWQVLLGLFPSEWRQLGRSSGAVRRLRGFPSLEALLRTLLLHVGCGWSLRETAVQAKLAGIAEVSDVTLLNRLRDAEDWLRQLCQQLWKDNGVELQPGFEGRTVRLLDATVVREPGKTGSQWRIHYSLRLPTLECDSFDLTPTNGAGAAERFGRFQFQPGELVLADAGYCHPAGIAAVVEQHADVCVRRILTHCRCGMSAEPHSHCSNRWRAYARPGSWQSGRYGSCQARPGHHPVGKESPDGSVRFARAGTPSSGLSVG
jgi:hypothetical protein